AGENPSLAGFPAVGDARTDGTSVRVSLTNMDPARFPVGCAGSTITVGGISGTAAVTPFASQAVPLVRATALNFQVPGTVAAGSAGETVSSPPAGLSVPVGSTGSASFAVGTSITLGVTNGRSVIWSGACSSGGIKTPTCTFTLSAAASETASVQ